jgi:hypothetical protein
VKAPGGVWPVQPGSLRAGAWGEVVAPGRRRLPGREELRAESGRAPLASPRPTSHPTAPLPGDIMAHAAF